MTTAKLGDDPVTSAKIVDGTGVDGRPADGAVTTAKLGDDSVTLREDRRWHSCRRPILPMAR